MISYWRHGWLFCNVAHISALFRGSRKVAPTIGSCENSICGDTMMYHRCVEPKEKHIMIHHVAVNSCFKASLVFSAKSVCWHKISRGIEGITSLRFNSLYPSQHVSKTSSIWHVLQMLQASSAPDTLGSVFGRREELLGASATLRLPYSTHHTLNSKTKSSENRHEAEHMKSKLCWLT